ncbi:MAG: TrpB-like pyridoxal phosphate-dependent enzyme [Pseudonocardiaceae bacterium]
MTDGRQRPEAAKIGVIDAHPIEVPTEWINLVPLLPAPVPPARDPDDGRPSRLALQERIRLRAMVEQDRSVGARIPIPGEVRAWYLAIGRPTPLVRAKALESYLDTPARIYFKREDLLPTGSFKLNSAVAQAYFAREEGATALVTETGAGQWGHAVAWASRQFGLRTVIFWASLSMRQKTGRHALLRMLDAELHASPSEESAVGRALVASGGHSLGSLGTAIGEAISYAAAHPDVRYVSGSNLPHVLMHQTVIGQEVRAQLAAYGERPDVLVACVGGGSNLGGFMGPFLPDKTARGDALRLVAAESAAAPRLTQGEWRYDHADPEGITPMTKSYTLGHDYQLPATHVGGLRQHSGSPIVGVLRQHNVIEPVAYTELEVFDTGRLVFQTEGFLAAPESCHALRATIEQALLAKRHRRADVIVTCVSGSGVFDMDGYVSALDDLHAVTTTCSTSPRRHTS